MSNGETKGLTEVVTALPEPNGFGSPLKERRAQAKAAAMDAGQQIATQFPDLERDDRIQLVVAFRAKVVPPRCRGRKRSKEVTAAHADWKSGVRGLALYRKHIPGFDRMSYWKRRIKIQALKDAIRSRNRRVKEHASNAERALSQPS